jgi:hypothetical protein
MPSPDPPPVRFPDPVRQDLEAERAGLADETERVFAAHVRPCVAVTAKRVAAAPLRRSWLASLFGAKPSAPVLGPLESKFGGAPYCEGDEDWTAHRFLVQIDLVRATAVLPDDAAKLTGLLRIDFGSGPKSTTETALSDVLRVRWFREPALARARPVAAECVADWETRLEFALGWTLPEGNALEALWPLKRPWYEYDRFDPPGYNEDGSDQFHRMLGHKSGGLDEHYGFTPKPGCSDDIDDYECLLRITYDNAAGLSWGTNWLYVLVPRDDLARGDLSRCVGTGANS